jgi:hypothetical protein
LEQETIDRLSAALRTKGLSEEQIQQSMQGLQGAFETAGRRNIKLWNVAKMTLMPASLLAMTLLTVHELGTSSAFSYALADALKVWLGDEKEVLATSQFLTALSLYGSAFASRLLGNVISRRIREGSMYFISSMASAIGTGLMIAANGTNVPLLLAGAVFASFGMGNFFAQLFEYITNLHPKYRPEVATLITYTMPLSSLLVTPFEWLKEISGMPLDLILSEAALIASFFVLPGMFADSSLVDSAKYYGKKIADAFRSKGKSGGTSANLPSDAADPLPAN